MSFAPIIIFAYNRPDSLKETVASLLKNPEAKDSLLFIFIDGPKNVMDKKDVDKVHEIANSIKGFKSVKIFSSEINKGLGDSIIFGVSKIIDNYDKVIVLEDDLILQPDFLSFINKGLKEYEDHKEVFSICGYTNKIKIPESYAYDAYFCARSSSWGWATWKDRWETVDWELNDWSKYKTLRKQYNKWGGSDCFGMLESWKNGLNKSWAIRFCFAQFLQNKVSLFPIKSLVQNDGFDGNGTNCKKWSRFKYELMDQTKGSFNFPENIEINHRIYKQCLHYHSIGLRIFSRIMYILKR